MNAESITGRVDRVLEDTINMINNSNNVVDSISSNIRAPLLGMIELTPCSSRSSSHSNSNNELLDPLPPIRMGSTPDSQHHPRNDAITSPPWETSKTNLPLPDAQLKSVMIQEL